ncbi:glycosyltransferase family 17 protein [Boeremia exigua]|uniref:glycosyltransferase family 17 protein n=1 Tax=Boeremia exigua TaxID=749465 RepID=UPI001E8CF6CE|nr:glycosyltransferase family 17 protein [Boeremia exigua]KAH6638392.1 glycosyltransferase family 17 protein [Boeremia exigua]
MLTGSNFTTRKRILTASAAAGLFCTIAFYLVPVLPLHPHTSSHDTAIGGHDVSLAASGERLSPLARSNLCSAHGVAPYHPHISPVNNKRKVYDLFMLNTELDWLEIRLHELASQVDYFVVLEAPTTFTGLPKKMFYGDNKKHFQQFEAKIIHHVLEPPEKDVLGHVENSTVVPGTAEYESHAWTMERYQRNAMFTQVLPFLTGDAAPNQDDVIIVSDIDEIPRPATVQLLRECQFGRMTTLRSVFYYYSFQWLHRGEEWRHPQATTYHGPSRTLLPASLRELDGSSLSIPSSELHTIWNSGWHCSSCFATIAEMLVKMQSFSHTNLNAERFRSRDRIVQHIREGKDLWDRWFQWYKRVDGNQDVPEYLKKEAEKGRFGYMINRDDKAAGFTDF